MTIEDIDASHYQGNSYFQFTKALDVLTLHRFHGDERILDVGCGDGRIAAELAKKVPKGAVKGIDPSKSMIDFAQKIFSPSVTVNLSFSIDSAENFRSKDRFDLITAFSSLHWVREQEAALKNLGDHLTPGGKLYVLTYPRESPYWRLFEDVLNNDKWNRYAKRSICPHWLWSSEYRDIADRLNFVVRYLETTDGKVAYNDEQHFIDYVKGWLPCLVHLPAAEQNSFLTDLAAHSKVLYSGTLEMPYKQIVIVLEKPT